MTWSARRSRVVLAAMAVFIGTVALRTTTESNADAVLALNTIPVVLVAFEFGWRGGAIAAGIALAWVIVWNEITLSALGYFSRGVTYFAAGLIVGTFADRLRAAQAAVVRSERRVAELALEQREHFEAAAIERQRLARELHDVIAHSVSVMTVQSTAARRVIEDDPERAATALEAIERTGRDAMAEMRRMVSVLRPDPGSAEMLTPQPSLDDLSTLIEPDGGRGAARRRARRGGAPPRARGGRRVRIPDRAGGSDQHPQACGHRRRGGGGALYARRARDRVHGQRRRGRNGTVERRSRPDRDAGARVAARR